MVEVKVEVQCSVCGQVLDKGYIGNHLWEVSPCKTCMEAAKVAGFNEGLTKRGEHANADK